MLDRIMMLTRVSTTRTSCEAGNSPKPTTQQQQRSTAISVLATSSRGAPMKAEHRELIESSSSSSPSSSSKSSSSSSSWRVGLCQDQRGPMDHLYPTPLLKGAIRVTMQQSATIFSNYMSDQLKEDMAREEKVQKGELSHAESEFIAEEWSEREWTKRWEGFSEKLLVAYVKYHAVTAIMRLYEYICSQTMSTEKLDKLTRDPFAAAKRREQRGETATSQQVMRECWQANLIAYLADYSVHQIILAFGYYVYIRDRRQRQTIKQQQQSTGPKKEDEDLLYAGSLALSFMKKSTLAALSRAVWLGGAALGGALGDSILPSGWGVLMGINMGDGMAASITDELLAPAALTFTDP